MLNVKQNRFLGVFWAITAIMIWSASLVMLRLGVTTSLNAYDLTALRFGVAAIVMIPLIIRKGLPLGRVGTVNLITMVMIVGAPYVVLLSLAMKTAPASVAGAINPGVMAVSAVMLTKIMYKDKIGLPRLTGLFITIIGISLFTGMGGAFVIGHVLLIVTGVMWAIYTLAFRRSGLSAYEATAIVAIGSALIFLPVYFMFLPKNIMTSPLSDVFIQGGFHGVFVSIFAMYAFNRSAELLGVVTASTLPALIPVVTLGLSVLMLGERARFAEIAAIAIITLGLAFILLGPSLRKWRRPRAFVKASCRS